MDRDIEVLLEAELIPHRLDRFGAEVMTGIRQADIIAGDERIGGIGHLLKLNHIVKLERQIDHLEFVVAVRPFGKNTKRHVDFGVRFDG